ncbi:MAG: sugar transferase [Acidobacteria bacterium]|nr:sugar transferase [Acidobacteriota bacterium]
MFSRHKRMIGVLYLAADAMLALGSFALAHWVRSAVIIPQPFYPATNYLWIVPLSITLWIGIGLMTGIYREIQEEKLFRVFWDPFKVAFFGTALLFAITFALKLEFISRLLLGFYALIDFFAMMVFRLAARRLGDPLRRTFGGYREFLVAGNGPEVSEVARAIEANEKRGMRIFAFARIGSASHDAQQSQHLRRSYPVYSLDRLPELVRQHVIDEVIFAVSKEEMERINDAFLLCEEEGVKTRVLLNFFPQLVSKVYLDRLEEMPLLTFTTTPENEYLLLLKRALDLVMALVFLVVLSPLFLLLSLVIKLTSRGPVLYRQVRCGLGGRKFTLYKFRSMRTGADFERNELAALNEVDGPVFKIKNDPRCTMVGRLMRKFSLDELPQLVNILKGDMSFVGPRPPLPEEVEKYAGWQRRRLRMLPGLTCLWALEGRSQLNFQRWMELDLEYIDNWSPALDLKILLKTIPLVLLGRGAS